MSRHAITFAAIGVIWLTVGAWIVATVLNMKAKEGKWPWASEVPVMVAFVMLSGGLILVGAALFGAIP